MIILSDCFSEKIDEGCIKVANKISKILKKKSKDNVLVSYGKKTEEADVYLNLNKFFINPSLMKFIREKACPVLYIPFASNTRGSAVRLLFLSMMSHKQVYVIFVLRFPMDKLTRWILKRSRAKIIALSRESGEFYFNELGIKTKYLKAGVDTQKFIWVPENTKLELRKKYGYTERDKIILHVGHLKQGRNVDKLLDIKEEYQVILVVSSVTKEEKELRKQLETRQNIKIIDTYLPNIEEIYQIADCYLFLVEKMENCIDVPLSVLEGAACGLPVVTTKYGELKEFIGYDGFEFIEEVNGQTINAAIESSLSNKKVVDRERICEYDWNVSADRLMEYIGEK